MKVITIAYWHGGKYYDLPFKHMEQHSYSTKKRNSIIDKILNSGYSIMLRPSEIDLIIWIDKGRFGQK